MDGMKIGLGIPGNMISRDTFRFARQAGATHIVAHLVSAAAGHPLEREGYRVSIAGDRRYGYEGLRDLREAIEAEGLTLEAIENAPADWSDACSTGPGERSSSRT
jgi:mannonate dehydratase